MTLQLEEKDLKIAKKLLKMELEDTNSKVYVFGSRAEGTARKFSDLDLAIDFNGQKMPTEIKYELENFFEASNISIRVDIVDLNAITENFKKIISPGLQEFSIFKPPEDFDDRQTSKTFNSRLCSLNSFNNLFYNSSSHC